MNPIVRFFSDLFPTGRWYGAIAGAAGLFFFAFFFPIIFPVAQGYTVLLLALTIADCLLLFRAKGGVRGHRTLSPRLSLGDNNPVSLSLLNSHSFPVTVKIIDELPAQFQERHFNLSTTLRPRSRGSLHYQLRPTERGAYSFGRLLAYVSTRLKLVERKVVLDKAIEVPVYPSFLHLRQHELMATSDAAFVGVRRVRRLGHSLEFETIKEYVPGDDARTVNWKATARRGGLMVNTYTDTRQQPVYCLLDAGRVMKMPFDGLTLLDHSINAALALLRVALLRHDRSGLLVFSNRIGEMVAADRAAGQMHRIQEALYAAQTGYFESDYQALWTHVHRQLPQRSFLLLFTNFETLAGLNRQLPYLRQLAKRHVLCVVFFQNTLLKKLRESQPETTEGIYIQTIADRFDYEKKLIVKELQRHGIIALLTTPKGLTGDVINRYLELKARQVI